MACYWMPVSKLRNGAASFYEPGFVRDTLANYALVLPMLLIARRLGFRDLGFFILIGVIGALPVAYCLANPLEFDYSPTYEDFVHGPYWMEAGFYALLGSVTGVVFWLGSRRPSESAPPSEHMRT